MMTDRTHFRLYRKPSPNQSVLLIAAVNEDSHGVSELREDVLAIIDHSIVIDGKWWVIGEITFHHVSITEWDVVVTYKPE